MTGSGQRPKRSPYGDWKGCHARLQEAGIGWIGRYLTCIAEKLDASSRLRDFKIHRGYGGLLDRPGRWRIRHAPIALLLPALLAIFLVFGPRPPLSLAPPQTGFGLAILCLLGLWAVLVAGMLLVREHRVFWLQMGWAFFAGVVLFLVLDPGNRQAEHVLYRHLLLVLVPWVLVPVTLGAKGLARLLISTVPDEHQRAFRQQLSSTELFVTPPEVRLTGWGALRSVMVTLLYRLLVVLYLPAVCLVALFPAGWTGRRLWVFTGLVAVAWLCAVSLTALHPRLDTLAVLFRRALFTGGQLVVSLVVIVLGLGRLAGVQYVSAIVESSYGPALSLILLSAYSFFWFYEYWINRVLCEELLRMLAPRAGRKRLPRDERPVGQVRYRIPASAVRTSVEGRGRVLQIHGGARFVTIGTNRWTGDENFQLYEKSALFERLAPPAGGRGSAGDGGGDEEDGGGDGGEGNGGGAEGPPEAAVRGEAWPDLQNRIRFHFALLNVALIGVLAAEGLLVFAGPQRPEHAVVEQREEEPLIVAAAGAARPGPATGGTGVGGATEEEGEAAAPAAGRAWRADLRRLIFDRGPGRDVVLLAASGGGTRAAMYTIGVLGGLSELGALNDLVLASGVSGGGAALAYYVGRRKDLLLGSPQAWRQFRCTLDDPFIQDVLDGAGEWRIFAQDRLGNLLAESFERRFTGGGPQGFGTLRDVGPGFALILNTAIAGRQGPLPCERGECFRECVHRLRRLTRGTETGGRLIFTNLLGHRAFPGLDELHPELQRLDYKVVDDPTVPLSSAAALNANFPPVFPNAAVDLEAEKTRYWVTDGGAVENRGVLSLLFALRHATRAQAALRPDDKAVLPRIHILVAEASAQSTGYSKLPGVGSKFGAPGKIASQLMKELVEEIQDELEAIGGEEARALVRLYYLDMPGPLRVDGGLGTHWMLAGNLRLGEPTECDPERRGASGNRPWVSGRAVRNATYALFLEETRGVKDARGAVHALSCSEEGADAEVAAQAARIQTLLDASLVNPGCWSQTYRQDWDELRTRLAEMPPGGPRTAWLEAAAEESPAQGPRRPPWADGTGEEEAAAPGDELQFDEEF